MSLGTGELRFRVENFIGCSFLFLKLALLAFRRLYEKLESIQRNKFVKEIQEFGENDIVMTKRLLKDTGEFQYFAFCTFSTLTVLYQFHMI